jgi:imidazolonepropionase-like amidohydrolase
MAGWMSIREIETDPMYEIEMMTHAGMTPMQIIIASKRNAAHVIGLEKVTGTLEACKIADVLVVNGDPLQNLQALAKVLFVVHYGQIFDPAKDQNSQD